MREIEVKAKVGDKAAILAAAKKLGIEFGPAKKQADLIFCWPGVADYTPGSIWLRIRTENDSKVLFTLKRDNGRRMDSTEYELEVASAKEMELIVLAMGYELYIPLTKVRRKAVWGNIELCLDQVDGLGVFLEAEILTNDAADHADVVKKLWSALHKLGAEKSSEVTDAYDVLLRNSQDAKT